MSVYASCDGIIASGSADNTVRLWDLRSQRCIDVMATGDSCVASVCINTPGNLLASGEFYYAMLGILRTVCTNRNDLEKFGHLSSVERSELDDKEFPSDSFHVQHNLHRHAVCKSL